MNVDLLYSLYTHGRLSAPFYLKQMYRLELILNSRILTLYLKQMYLLELILNSRILTLVN
jgi:hypothetical protein